MTEWRAMTSGEIADLAVRLRSLDWSWEIADGSAVAAEFGWQVDRATRGGIVLDVGFGRASGEIHIDDRRADEFDLRVTEYVPEDAAGRVWLRDTFATMTHAITDALGEPTTRIPGWRHEVRWAGPDTTVVLRSLHVSVHLYLVTNSRIAADDRIEELEEQGLL